MEPGMPGSLSHEDNLCSVVSHYGIALSCDQPPKFTTVGLVHGWEASNKVGASVYVSGNDLPRFSRIVGRFSEPLVIVVGGDDRIMPYDYDADSIKRIATCDKVLAVFSHNNALSGRFRSLPIGIDYHTLFKAEGSHPWGETGIAAREQEASLFKARLKIPHISECRSVPVLSNFHLSMSKPPRRSRVRQAIVRAIEKVEWIKWLPAMNRVDLWMAIGDSAFMLCPSGQGNDTHRVWETLALGRIPIVDRTSTSQVYDGLPVWLVDDWREFAEMNEGHVREKLSAFVAKWNDYEWQRITLSFWMTAIREAGYHV